MIEKIKDFIRRGKNGELEGWEKGVFIGGSILIAVYFFLQNMHRSLFLRIEYDLMWAFFHPNAYAREVLISTVKYYLAYSGGYYVEAKPEVTSPTSH